MVFCHLAVAVVVSMLGLVPNGTLPVHLQSCGLTMAAICLLSFKFTSLKGVPFGVLHFRRVLSSNPFVADMCGLGGRLRA